MLLSFVYEHAHTWDKRGKKACTTFCELNLVIKYIEFLLDFLGHFEWEYLEHLSRDVWGKTFYGPCQLLLMPCHQVGRSVQENDLWLINLLNGIQKIISNFLANRLELVMHSILLPNQLFLKGRNIFDAFVTDCDLIGWGCKTKKKGVRVKVDFEMAYNRIK